MPAQTYVWDLQNLSLSFLGLMIEGGFGESSAVKAEPDEPYYAVKKGVDGSVTRYATGSRLCKITITLMQASDANNILAAILTSAINVPNGGGLGPFLLKDKGGATLVQSPAAWVEGYPSIEMAAESKDREWVLWASKAKVFAGGNFALTPFL